MNVRYRVHLTDEERIALRLLCEGGTHRARRIKRAQILLAADLGIGDGVISTTLAVGTSTVYRTKQRFVEQGMEAALSEVRREGAPRKLSDKEEVLLMALACTSPPKGWAHWTLTLLADQMVSLTAHASIGRETVRRRLHEKFIKPRQHKMWCIAKVDAEYIARMEDVLDLYTRPTDSAHPVVCFDETPVQLIGESRASIPASSGRPARIDYEYCRNGTCNLFVFLDAHQP